MNKRSSGVKITPSVNNLIFLFLLAFSIFIIYRYVKSLEKELTLLKTELNRVKTASPQTVPQKTEQVCVDDVCMMVDVPSVENEEDDMESVTSKDILKIVDQINNDDSEEVVENKSEEETTDEPIQIKEEVNDISQSTPESSTNTNEEDIIIKKTTNSYEDELYKKTNEELKKVLKDQGKNTKGAKAELIKRIMEDV